MPSRIKEIVKVRQDLFVNANKHEAWQLQIDLLMKNMLERRNHNTIEEHNFYYEAHRRFAKKNLLTEDDIRNQYTGSLHLPKLFG